MSFMVVPFGSLFDQYPGTLLHPDNFFSRMCPLGMSPSHYYRPWTQLARQGSGVSTIKNEKDQFSISLDVQQFRPEEVTVKTVGNSVVIEGSHEEKKDDHGFVSRHFVRRYDLPKDVEPETVVSTLSSDGVLTVSAPKKALPAIESNERVVPIQKTEAPAVTQEKKEKS